MTLVISKEYIRDYKTLDYGMYKEPRACLEYDFGKLRQFKILFVEPSDETTAKIKAETGRLIISKLPTKFKLNNQGKFVAITFTGKILAICDTLETLNRELARKNLKENYYVERIGYDTIAQI